MKKLLSILLILTLLMMFSVSGTALAQQDSDPTEELRVEATEKSRVAPTEEPTAEPTEEPTAEPTEEPTAEPTEEPTAEPTEEPTAEPTEEPTAEPTEEPTAEPTEEPTAEPTEEPTVEPTEEPTVEPTVEPTQEIELGTQGEIGAQAYTGSWTSYVTVQNMGSTPANVTVSWYPNGLTACSTQSNITNLGSGAATNFSVPSACGSSFIGSAVVSSDQPAAAVVGTLGSVNNLFSTYTGSSQGSTEAWLLPMLNNTNWDPLVGVSNLGSGTANVRITLVSANGAPFGSPYDTTIPANSARQISVRNDITTSAWGGTIRVENNGTSEELYAVVKAEREQYNGSVISLAYEGYRETTDARTEWVLPVLSRNSASTGSSTPTAMNQAIIFQNPSGSNTVQVTIQFFNGDGTLRTTYTTTLAPNGVSAISTFQVNGLPTSWGGTGAVSAVVQGTSTPAPILAMIQPYYSKDSSPGTKIFTTWDAYKAIDPNSGAGTVYLPAIRGGTTTNPVGSGWVSSINVSNLASPAEGSATVQYEFFGETGALVGTETQTIAAGGRGGYATSQLSYLSNFNGSVRMTVTSGPTKIAATGSNGLSGYPTTYDAFGMYSGFSN